MPRMHDIGPRQLTSLYVAGPFSMGYVDFFTFLIPLYGLSLGLDAGEIGVLVGARSILALFLSIHIGVLMDRFGTRADACVRLDRDVPGSALSAGGQLLGIAAAAAG
jgi:MFS family permease